MPKVKSWNVGEGEKLTAEDLESASADAGYAGPLPPAGLYKFTIKRLKKTTFGSKNEGISVLAELDGSHKPEHAAYDKADLWDQLVMTKASAPFVKGFCDAIGVTYRDILNGVVTDEEGLVTRIGTRDMTKPTQVFILVKHDPYEGVIRIKKKGTGYQAVRADDAKPGKKVKGDKATGKKGKKAKEDDPPF